MRFLLVHFIFILSSCSSLKTPQFKGPGQNSTTRTSSPQAIELEWPVPVPARVTQKFKSGNKRSRHQGIDLGGPRGTPILAAHEGIVIYAGRDFRGFGNLVILENQMGYATFYAHLDKIQTQEGTRLRTGQQLGTMGRTGRATGVHLHFELRISKIAVDPLPYLPTERHPAHFVK
jgi:murein DD-endopeptidase MepM/ murein hydrolase activator NlpD